MAFHLGSRDVLLSVFVCFLRLHDDVHISREDTWDGQRCSWRQMLIAALSNVWQVQCVLLQGLFKHDFIQKRKKKIYIERLSSAYLFQNILVWTTACCLLTLNVLGCFFTKLSLISSRIHFCISPPWCIAVVLLFLMNPWETAPSEQKV